ncbi:receptor-type guanylate cyclase Gyc76C-like [Epargyreus clarus]|uniref:receptor-type guanylate cyclase Gyc76C-like n=1 Tax=Epargyreus clarus TaxID=520877 RepID=UPI003C3078CA
MCNGAKMLVVALGLLAGLLPVIAKNYNITVGYLPCIEGNSKDMQGLAISGAISMALDNINNSTEILPDVTLLLQWNDTQCDTLTTTRLLTNMVSSGAVAFFGPEEICETPDVIEKSKNLPMISYKCSDSLVSKAPNFARLEPSVSKITQSVISLLRYYKWNKFSVLYEETYEKAALTLENDAKMINMTLNHRRLTDDSWSHIIQDTKNATRIYVFFGSTSALVEMMNTMEALQLFTRGEYMVIFIDMMPYWPKDPLDYLIPKDRQVCPMTPEFRKRARSLLVVVSSEPESSYENFAKKVQEYNSMKPFEFPLPSLENKFSIYAAYLYDSVRLYAAALHNLIEEETIQNHETLTYEKLKTIATDGSRIVSKMITITPFKSVVGNSIRFDENAHASGNYMVLGYKPLNHTNSQSFEAIRSNINCTHSMISFAHFQESTKKFPVYTMNPHLPIDWPDNVRPEDEPSCGFYNEKC